MPYVVDGREYEGQDEFHVKYKCTTSKADHEVYILLGYIHEGGDPDADFFMTKMLYSEKEEIGNN